MSVLSWADEFYPTPASVFFDSIHGFSLAGQIAATEHSLQKWRGLRTENLERHGVRVQNMWKTCAVVAGAQNLEDLSVVIGADSCSLCEFSHGYTLYSKEEAGTGCEPCPIVKFRGVPCDRMTVKATLENDDAVSEWHTFRYGGGPERMIKLLEDTLSFLNLKAQEPKQPTEEEEQS